MRSHRKFLVSTENKGSLKEKGILVHHEVCSELGAMGAEAGSSHEGSTMRREEEE